MGTGIGVGRMRIGMMMMIGIRMRIRIGIGRLRNLPNRAHAAELFIALTVMNVSVCE